MFVITLGCTIPNSLIIFFFIYSLGCDERAAKLASQNRRVSIDIKPESYEASGGRNGLNNNRRSEVIDYISRRATKFTDQ